MNSSEFMELLMYMHGASSVLLIGSWTEERRPVGKFLMIFLEETESYSAVTFQRLIKLLRNQMRILAHHIHDHQSGAFSYDSLEGFFFRGV